MRNLAKQSLIDGLRKTMRKVPLPVVIVTANDNGKLRGMTCSSFNSISLQPPIVSFAINLPSTTQKILEESQLYAVHLLSSEQTSQSIAFSSPKTQGDFQSFPHYIHGSDVKLPILQGCLSVLICKAHSAPVVGDHQVWYSQVLEILPDGIKKSKDKQDSYEELKPLLYYDGSYRNIGDQVFIQSFENTRLKFAEWTHRAHVRMAWIYFQDQSDPDPNSTIKKGIKQYNQANSDRISHGYNETITEFFCQMVKKALVGSNSSDFMDFLQSNPRLDSFATILDYYSKDLLYSDKAKQEFVSPDLRPLPEKASDL